MAMDADAVIQLALYGEDGESGETPAAVAIRQLCATARESQLPVATIVIAIERAWLRSIEVRRMEREAARSLLDQLVTCCLRAFYFS